LLADVLVAVLGFIRRSPASAESLVDSPLEFASDRSGRHLEHQVTHALPIAGVHVVLKSILALPGPWQYGQLDQRSENDKDREAL
jgi:hypothetical protein